MSTESTGTDRLDPPVSRERDHISGPIDAPVTLVEYGDFECPHCRRAHAGVMRIRDERLPRQVRYVYRHLPHRRVHPNAQKAAEASEAAAAQGKFWEMHRLLFEHDGALDRDSLVRAATELRLDMERFTRELDEGRYAAIIDGDLASAERSGARATPTFFVDGLRYTGPWDEESVLDAVFKPVGWRIRLLAQQFAGLSASSGLLMLVAVVLALVWANSAWRDSYHAFWETPLSIGFGSGALELSLLHWVNDGLIVLFFLVVGLEIRRELTIGDLKTPRRAGLPVAAAIGGMLVPVLMYLIFNAGGPQQRGWGVPMATDTAFALGLLALLGPRVPMALRVFVAAAAIADDVGAIIVIAFFYTPNFSAVGLAYAVALLMVLIGFNRWRVFNPLPYAIVGVLLWFAVLQSGIHPTLAGVLLAFTIPTRGSPNTSGLLAQAQAILLSLDAPVVGHMNEARYRGAVRELEGMTDRLLSPAERLARDLQPWSAYLALPVFAFANAGVALSIDFHDLLEPVSVGVLLGLVLGKPLGITLGSWLSVRAGLAALPEEMSWYQIAGAGFLCGIGFTMSYFIANVAFTDEGVLSLVKLSVLFASVIAGAAGWIVLQAVHRGLGRPGR